MVLGGCWLGTGIAPSGTHPYPIPRVHPPGPGITQAHRTAAAAPWEYGRGAQIGSSTHFIPPFLRVLGITEVYNLCTAGNANDHNVIPGIK